MLIIDRFEGNYAIIEVDDEFINIPKSFIPTNAKEGDVLRLVIDESVTSNRKQQIDNLVNKLFKS